MHLRKDQQSIQSKRSLLKSGGAGSASGTTSMPPNQMRPHDKTPLSQNSHSKKAPSDVVQADIKLPHLHPNKSNVA